MENENGKHDQVQVQVQVLTIREASEWLKVSEKTLWTLTHPRGTLAVVRIGSLVRYRMQDLETFVNQHTQQ